MWIEDLASGGDVVLDRVGDGLVGGPFLEFPVDEDGANSHERDAVWRVDAAPAVLGGVEELVGLWGRNEPWDFESTTCMFDHDDFSEVEALEEQCQGDFFPACDVLYNVTIIGSSEEDVATSCGGRRETSSPPGTCVLEFGFGSR